VKIFIASAHVCCLFFATAIIWAVSLLTYAQTPTPTPTPTPKISCQRLNQATCEGAHYPDLVQCDDFMGYTALPNGATAPYSLRLDTPFYSVPACAGTKLSRLKPMTDCHYEASPGPVDEARKNNFKPGDYQAPETDLVGFFALDQKQAGCGDAGIAHANATQSFCAALITCKATKTHLKVCRAKANGLCPGADACEKENVYSFETPAKKAVNDYVEHVDPFLGSDLAGRITETYQVVDEPGFAPQVLKFGNRQCFVVVKSTGVFGESYFTASARAVDEGCPPLHEILTGKCFGRNPSGGSNAIDHRIHARGEIGNIDQHKLHLVTPSGASLGVSRELFAKKTKFHPGAPIELVLKDEHIVDVAAPPKKK
jgi:hypothetical protein